MHYSWLLAGAEGDAELGDYGAIRAERYWPDDFLAETRFQNVERVVHVQAALGIEDPVEETKWLQSSTDRVGIPHGIIAYADLSNPDVSETLARHAEYPALRGIRDFRYDDYYTNPDWERGFELLGRLGLVCCDDPLLDQVPAAIRLARRHPDVTLCIDHAGFPKRRDTEYFREWRSAIEAIAELQNTVIKISGLGQCDHRWTVESLRPWILSCIDAFGAKRSFFGTNWPVDRLFSSYGDVLDAYAAVIADFTDAEQHALSTGNARRIFDLDRG